MDAKKVMNNTILMFGLLFGMVIILFNFINPPTSDPETTNKGVLGMISLVLLITIPILAVKYYKDKDLEVTLGKAVKIGVLVGLLGGFIGGIYGYIYFAYINPDAVDQVIEMSNKMLAQNDMFSEEMLEKQAETTKSIFLPMQILANAFAGLLYGVIGGLLGGLFFKTPNEDY